MACRGYACLCNAAAEDLWCICLAGSLLCDEYHIWELDIRNLQAPCRDLQLGETPDGGRKDPLVTLTLSLGAEGPWTVAQTAHAVFTERS